MGAAMLAFFGAKLRRGIPIVVETAGLEAIVKAADLVITGEGRIDSQSIHGKNPIGVAAVAKRYGKPVKGIAGSLSHAVFSVLSQVGTLEEAFTHASANLRAVTHIAAALKLAGGLHLK